MFKWISIGLGVVGALLVAFIVAGYIFPAWAATTRDIAIVILSVLQILSVVLMIALLLALLYVVMYIRRLVDETITPQFKTLTAKVDGLLETTRAITGNVQETTTTVSTTTAYVAERVVSPVIRVAGLMAGVRAAARFLAQHSSVSEIDNG